MNKTSVSTMDTFHNKHQFQLEAERLDLHALLEEFAQSKVAAKNDSPKNYVERLLDKLARVCAALKRIDSGTFGVCPSCQQLISIERLQQMAYAELCWSCQRQREINETKRCTKEQKCSQRFSVNENFLSSD